MIIYEKMMLLTSCTDFMEIQLNINNLAVFRLDFGNIAMKFGEVLEEYVLQLCCKFHRNTTRIPKVMHS